MNPPRPRELGRGERVLPGIWRLRLPLPWPGVPHCNAWALAAGDGIVLVDTGMHEPGSLAHLERAMQMVNLRIDHVRLLVVTHAHADHFGQALPIVERSGCDLWMNPNLDHARAYAEDPDGAFRRRIEVARQSGVPEAPLRRWAERRQEDESGMSGPLEPARDLLPGVEVVTDHGVWQVHETPGHAPSHVVLHEPESGLLVSGDHLLGRISLFYDHGHTPDPVAEFIASLDVVDELDIRLCLPGHGRTFRDVAAKIAAYRKEVDAQLGTVRDALRDGEKTPFGVVEAMLGEGNTSGPAAAWALQLSLAYLDHLEALGEAERTPGTDPVLWRSTG